MNILTERQQCELRCGFTHWKLHDLFPKVGDARQCEHGRWWIATGAKVEDRYFRWFDEWRPATWSERRRARKAASQAANKSEVADDLTSR